MSLEVVLMLKWNSRPFYGRKKVDAGIVGASVNRGRSVMMWMLVIEGI